jgi:DNA polymerase
MNRNISLDWETYYNTKIGYGIKELGMWRYVHDEKFDPYLLSVSDGEDSWAGHRRNFNWDALNGQTLLSHNAHFDSMVYNAALERGMVPSIAPKDWLCTANMSAYLCNRRALDSAADHLLGVALSKETRDYANGKTEKDMVADGKWDEMLRYARSDAFHCHQLFAKHGHLWPEHERRLSEMTIRQGVEGIQINETLLREYIVIATQALRVAEEQLPWVKEGRPPTSPKAISELCRANGIPCPPVKSREGEDAFIAWEKNYCTKFPWIEHVANWRSINKFLDSLQTIQTRLSPTGILSFSLKYFGAHTGRWAGDAGMNFQNFRKEPLYLDDKYWLISDLTRLKEIAMSEELPGYVVYSLDIRKLLGPRFGKKMIISDLSQIEPRVLAWLVRDESMLALMAQGQSPYEAHARVSMNWTGGNMKKEDKAGYALAKARVLALGYGCGWEKFILMAKIYADIDLTEHDPEFVQATNDEGEPCFRVTIATDKEPTREPIMVSGYGFTSRQIVNDYRLGNTKVTGLWKSLNTDFQNSVGGDFEMTLPSGRVMRYRNVRREVRSVPREDGKPGYKRKIVHTAEIGERRFSIYGGLLTENLVQATARDVFAEHLLNLNTAAGVKVLFSVHDEAVCETDPEVTVKDIENIMSKTPEWMKGCPVAAEGCEVAHYKK